MNTFKTAFLLTALTLVLLFFGQVFGGQNGLILALVIAVVMNFTAYFFSDKIALTSAHAQPINREESPRLYAVMERLSAKANIPVPKLYMIPEAAPNAFATGRNPHHASVAVTQGLMQLMDDEELEGDLTVVDGFQYTPMSSTVDDDTPDSSVIDCSPRMSCDTGRTVVTSGEERD